MTNDSEKKDNGVVEEHEHRVGDDPSPRPHSEEAEATAPPPQVLNHHDGPNELSASKRFTLVAIVTFTVAMSSAGLQGLNIALPTIQNELGISETNLQWVSSAYSLTFGCFLLLSGRLADVYGRKRCFCLGISWYAVWTLVGGFLHSGPGFIVTRALAGMGASMG